MAALYRGDGRGHFTDVTASSGLAARGWGMGTCIADIDNDGFDDVYVTAYGPNVLYRNTGSSTGPRFKDVTQQAGVGDARWSTGCAFGDYNRDGFVDLYVANYVSFDARKIAKRGASSNCRYVGFDVFCGPRGLTPRDERPVPQQRRRHVHGCHRGRARQAAGRLLVRRAVFRSGR